MPNRPLCVLIADDEAAMRMVLEMRLRDWGYDTLLATDGEEAERMVQKHQPDIILSDVAMPGKSGISVRSP